jgi:hypothetical protein
VLKLLVGVKKLGKTTSKKSSSFTTSIAFLGSFLVVLKNSQELKFMSQIETVIFFHEYLSFMKKE